LGMAIFILAIAGTFLRVLIQAGIERLIPKLKRNDSNKKFIACLLIGEIPCIICIYIFLFRLVNPLILSATMSSTFSTIVNEKTNPRQFVPQGNGVIKYDVSSSLYSYEYIPFEKIAKEKDNVRFIIKIERREETIGKYTDYVLARRWTYVINLIDINNLNTDYSIVLLGEEPPQTRTNKTSGAGKPPSYQIIRRWIEETISSLE
jgi:hypothetical protein